MRASSVEHLSCCTESGRARVTSLAGAHACRLHPPVGGRLPATQRSVLCYCTYRISAIPFSHRPTRRGLSTACTALLVDGAGPPPGLPDLRACPRGTHAASLVVFPSIPRPPSA